MTFARCRSSLCCFSSAPLRCAARDAPGTTLPTAISTPWWSGRGRARFRRAMSASRKRPALTVFYALAVVLIAVALWLAGAGWPAWIGLAAFAAHLCRQIANLETGDPAHCLRLFKSNRDAGLLLFAGLLADAMLPGT